MQLNHFADPFQNGHASVDQFFEQSNMLTGQYDNQTLGYGYSQNPSGYEWSAETDAHHQPHQGGHAQEFKGNGGYHNQVPPGMTPTCTSGTCGADPHALARANLQWERAETFQGMSPEQIVAYQAQMGSAAEEPEYIYSGPDDLDYDDESVAPNGGVPYWHRRMPTIVIHGATVLFWIWLWSTFGFSKLLTGSAGNVVYWGFIGVMAWGAFHADHRAALYSEEREVQKGTESVLKLIVKMVAVIATILLSFDVMKKRAKLEQHAIYAALGVAFFSGMIGLMSFSARKRGETVRRYRKVKGALLNLAIGMIAVAALLSFGFGTSGATVVMTQKGGQPPSPDAAVSAAEPTQVVLPAPEPPKQVIVVTPPPPPPIEVQYAPQPEYQSVPPTYPPPESYQSQPVSYQPQPASMSPTMPPVSIPTMPPVSYQPQHASISPTMRGSY